MSLLNDTEKARAAEADLQADLHKQRIEDRIADLMKAQERGRGELEKAKESGLLTAKFALLQDGVKHVLRGAAAKIVIHGKELKEQKARATHATPRLAPFRHTTPRHATPRATPRHAAPRP